MAPGLAWFKPPERTALSKPANVVGKPRKGLGPHTLIAAKLEKTTTMKSESFKLVKLLALIAVTTALVACGGNNAAKSRNLGLPSYSTGKGGTATTVNRYLWAASLETLDFLPIHSADPIAGLIISDWYVNPEAPTERFKTTVYILDNALRADALRVSVFKQGRDETGAWIDATVNPATSREIENAILTRARQLRLNVIDG